MIGHEVEQDAQMLRPRRLDEARPCRLAAEIRADMAGIGDVVAMHAAGVGLQARREVHMAYAELGEIGKDSLRVP